MKTRVYVDTFYLLAAIDSKSRQRSEAKDLLRKLTKPPFELIIPQLVLGELVAVILKKYDEGEAITKFEELTHMTHNKGFSIEDCLVPPKNNAFECMEYLKRNDPQLDYTDIMIISHALADPYSKFFYTVDKKLIGTREIRNLEQKLRKKDGIRKISLEVRDWPS